MKYTSLYISRSCRRALWLVLFFTFLFLCVQFFSKRPDRRQLSPEQAREYEGGTENFFQER